MTESERLPPDEIADQALEQALEHALPARQLVDAALGRVRVAVVNHWRAAGGARRPWQRWHVPGLAAGVLLVAAGLTAAWVDLSGRPAVFGLVARDEPPGLEVRPRAFWSRMVAGDGRVTVGETITARGGVLVLLKDGGTLRLAGGSAVEVVGASEVRIHRGRVYVDLTLSVPRRSALIVDTPLGRIDHLGTQFEVATLDRGVRIRVRERHVRVARQADIVEITAGTQLVVTPGRNISRSRMATNDPEWAWVEALAPDYDLDNRRLVDFLEWVARETGHKLDIVDERARRIADTTKLHGSVHGLPPLKALTNVMATTSLRFELRNDEIRVMSADALGDR